MTSGDAKTIRIRHCLNCKHWLIDVVLSHEMGFACGKCCVFGQHRTANARCSAWERIERND